MGAHRRWLAATVAVTAMTAVGFSAQGAEVLTIHGAWQAEGDYAVADVSTGFWLPPPYAYIVKWSSPQPFGEGSFEDYAFQFSQHYETWEGEVLFDFHYAEEVGPIYLPIGARSWSFRLFPYDVLNKDPVGFYSETWREADTLHARAGPEAIGQPYTFSISTVPEPPSWGMAITGMLFVGAALRQARRRLSA